ncbi:MAG: UDP-glucose 4-epimerase GalE [Desulfobacteraceae bacterium]|nr:UDP-glucose 4-epimerase GalE [Desulfobacteraceae bacterium]
MDVLVVGGAGYIGSFVSRMLLAEGYRPTVLDNLSLGHRAALDPAIPLVTGDLADTGLLGRLFSERHFDAVMHFAALASVAESVQMPLTYYRNNVANTLNLLDAMRHAGVGRFIFSSSAAIFGSPERIPIDEHHPARPINPYGRSKLMVEEILQDAAAAGDLQFVALRYFNAAGASPDGRMGEDHRCETHLIPLVLKAALKGAQNGPALKVFGTDYPTPDGTCVRDYIHVSDLARAHLLALDHLAAGGASAAFNLGNGKGFSVMEVIATAEKVTGRRVAFETAARRDGDPPILVAAADRISRELGWQPAFPTLEVIIETAWKWHASHPGGYSAVAT